MSNRFTTTAAMAVELGNHMPELEAMAEKRLQQAEAALSRSAALCNPGPPLSPLSQG